MDKFFIRPVTTNDLAMLQQISRQTFTETFAEVNTAENMAKYLEEELSLERLSAELSTPSSEFYFAVLNDQVIGYLKLNTGHSQTELKDSRAVEIERIYVSKAFHGKNIGQLLYEKAIRSAREKKAEYVWLGVWEENTKAIGFYKKNGFVEFDKHIFRLGEDEQTDIMMRKKVEY